MKRIIDIINDLCSGLLLLVVETVGLLWLYCGDIVPRSLRLRLILLLLFFGTLGLSGQEIFKGGERQPFDSQPLSQSMPALKAPGTSPGLPPPTDQNMVGGVPVRDIFWLWPLMAVGYGIYKKRVCKKNADDADNADFRG